VRHAPLFAIVAAVAIAEILPHTRLARWLAKWEMFSFGSDPRSQGILTRCVSEGRATVDGDSPSLARRVSVRRALCASVPWLVLTALALQVCRVPVPIVGHGWARHDPHRWPVELLPELGALEAERPGARVLNTLDFGGFLAFHTPKLKTFIDDRCELYGVEFLSAYAEAEVRRPEQIDVWAEKYGIEAALVRAGSPFDRHLAASAHWRVVRQTAAATLYRKRDVTVGS
jgi:hypothetical protein